MSMDGTISDSSATITEIARVITFFDDENDAEMELVSVSPTSGLCKCVYRSDSELGEVTVARHRDRVRALNDAAKTLLAAAVAPHTKS